MPLQQLVLHPTVNKSLKYASTTVGRDKTYRTVQYFSRFLVWYFKRQGYTKETIQIFANLKSTLGLSRKLMRLGKPMEHLQNASKAFNETDEFAKFAILGRQLSYAAYLFWDTFAWVHGAGVYKFNQIQKITTYAYRFWLTGILFSILHGLYKYHHIYIRKNYFERISKSEDGGNVEQDIAILKREYKNTVRQLVQDLLDITIPATALKYIDLGEGFVGLAGVLSSLLGAQSQWKKVTV